MPKRVSDSARILNFFSDADLGSATTLYELTKAVMDKRLAPAKAVRAAKRKKKDGPAAVPQATSTVVGTKPAA